VSNKIISALGKCPGGSARIAFIAFK